MNHDVLTEFEITSFGIGDILDISTRITCQYEIETTLKSAKHQKTIQKYARKGLDIIIVFTPKLPFDEYERYKYLKDVIIVPD
jgi:pentose-5-phosphate-3-epimerase